jgi:hypothetical protein
MAGVSAVRLLRALAFRDLDTAGTGVFGHRRPKCERFALALRISASDQSGPDLSEGLDFRKLPSGPPLTIVRPCFGQICIECLRRGRRRNGMRSPSRVTLVAGQVPQPHFGVPTAKACDGTGKVWRSQDSRF